MEKMFVYYGKTKAEFIADVNGLPAKYKNSIVFIKGDAAGNGSCIYTHEMYFANFTEFIATYISALNYVKGVSVGGQSYNAATGGGYVAFSAADPSTVKVNAGSTGIEIGLTKDFTDKVKNTADDLGTKDDVAKADGSAFARIANLASLVSNLTGDSDGSIKDQIDALRTEITGDLSDATDAKTIAAINDELNGLDEAISNLTTTVGKKVTIDDVNTAIANIGVVTKSSDELDSLVNVTVETKGGSVSSVLIYTDDLNTALNGKADLDENSKILMWQLPDSILGQVMFGGTAGEIEDGQFTVDSVSSSLSGKIDTHVGDVLTTEDAEDYEGVYFICSTASSSAWNGVEYAIGDWIISTGSAWVKIDNTDAVASVAGLTGTISTQALQQQLSYTGDNNYRLISKTELTHTVAGIKVTAEGDSLISASVDEDTGRNITIEATDNLKGAVEKANYAVQSVAEGTTNGAILVDNTPVSVHGLKSAAYVEATKFVSDVDCRGSESSPEGEPVWLSNGTLKVAIGDFNSDELNHLGTLATIKAYVDGMFAWEEYN